jgi:hypothetical protein
MEGGVFPLTAVSSNVTSNVTFQEDKELRRVFDLLCDYQSKQNTEYEYQIMDALLAKLPLQQRTEKKFESSQSREIKVETAHAVQEHIDELKRDITNILNAIEKKLDAPQFYDRKFEPTLSVEERVEDVKKKIAEFYSSLYETVHTFIM